MGSLQTPGASRSMTSFTANAQGSPGPTCCHLPASSQTQVLFQLRVFKPLDFLSLKSRHHQFTPFCSGISPRRVAKAASWDIQGKMVDSLVIGSEKSDHLNMGPVGLTHELCVALTCELMGSRGRRTALHTGTLSSSLNVISQNAHALPLLL